MITAHESKPVVTIHEFTVGGCFEAQQGVGGQLIIHAGIGIQGPTGGKIIGKGKPRRKLLEQARSGGRPIAGIQAQPGTGDQDAPKIRFGNLPKKTHAVKS